MKKKGKKSIGIVFIMLGVILLMFSTVSLLGFGLFEVYAGGGCIGALNPSGDMSKVIFQTNSNGIGAGTTQAYWSPGTSYFQRAFCVELDKDVIPIEDYIYNGEISIVFQWAPNCQVPATFGKLYENDYLTVLVPELSSYLACPTCTGTHSLPSDCYPKIDANSPVAAFGDISFDIAECHTDDDCSEGEYCVDYDCVDVPCEDDGDICTREVVSNHVCQHEPIEYCCHDDSECSENEVCIENVCTEKVFNLDIVTIVGLLTGIAMLMGGMVLTVKNR